MALLFWKIPNNCVFINDGTIVYIQNVIQVGDDVEIVGFRFLKPEPLLEPILIQMVSVKCSV